MSSDSKSQLDHLLESESWKALSPKVRNEQDRVIVTLPLADLPNRKGAYTESHFTLEGKFLYHQ